MELAEIETLVKDNPEAVAAIKAANERLGKFGDLEAKASGAEKLAQDIANLKAVNDDLLKQKDEWKKGHTGSQAEHNALLERQKATEAKLEEMSKALKAADEEKAKAITEGRQTDLKAKVMAAASEAKAIRPEEEFIILQAKGLIGHDDKGQPFFHKLNDKGEPVKVADAKELLTWWIDRDKTRQAAGSGPGIGGDHRGGAPQNDAPKSRAEARAAFRAARGA